MDGALLCNKYARIRVNESISGVHGLAVSQKPKKKNGTCVKEHESSREEVQDALDPCGEPGTVGRGKRSPREPGILLSDGIHFPSRKVHPGASVGGGGRPKFSPLLLAGYRSTAGRWQKKRSNLQSDAEI